MTSTRWMLLVAVVLLAGPVRADDERTYIGSDLCAGCHDELATMLAPTPHGTALADESRPESARGCEACHGPGSAHFEAGGEGNIRVFDKEVAASERSKPCRTCHAGNTKRHVSASSEHTLAGVACNDCHRIHQPPVERLLARPVPQLCYGCHGGVRAQFALPEHHEVDEGVLTCLDCHNPHGTRNAFSLLGAHDRTCERCHGDMVGPFVFEHTARLIEGCVGCHVPHGSVNRHLLKRQSVAQLCYQCHAVTPPEHSQPNFRDCTRCHVAIHGSNSDPRFLER